MADPANAYTHASIPATFARTALPIILFTSVNGLLTVVDAIFLGAFVGADALTAVTMVFPVSMLMIALATMVSSGMASVLGRLLGANRFGQARAIFAGAHGLSLCISAIAIALFALVGWPIAVQAAHGSTELATMGHSFLRISIYTSPLLFLLSVHSDALRTEGRVGFMTIAGLLVTLANIGFNYLLIVPFGLGVGLRLAASALPAPTSSPKGSGRESARPPPATVAEPTRNLRRDRFAVVVTSGVFMSRLPGSRSLAPKSSR